MTHANQITPSVRQFSLRLRILLVAGIAMVFIIVLLYGVKHPKPQWGSLWMVKPLIIVPLAGALGGIFTYIMSSLPKQNAWQKALGEVLGFMGYIIALWLGTVLGLNGTLWN